MPAQIKVETFDTKTGTAPNQFKIITPEAEIFQSYDSIVAIKHYHPEKVILDAKHWDYSKTTGKYRNIFLGESKAETEKKIKTGEYLLQDLN